MQEPMQRRRQSVGFWIAVGVAVLAVLLAMMLAVRSCSPTSSGRDANALAGQLASKTPEEQQAELDRIVEEGMFNISIASSIEFADGASPGELRIENVPSNRYLMRVEIAREDTGEVVFASGIIEPNHHIQSAKLDVDLEAGAYPCMATFFALDPESEEVIGQAAARITLNVLA